MKKDKLQQKNSTNVRFISMILFCYGLLLNILGAISLSLGTRWAIRTFLSTHRSRKHPKERALENTATRTWLQQGDHRVACYVWGSGPTILLVHGWNGRGAQLGELVPPLLERGYRVVTFDAVGHGESDGKHSTIFKLAEGIRLVQEQMGPFHGMITHSMGGAAATLAVASGLNVGRLVYISPPYNPPGWLDRFADTLKISDKILNRMKQFFETRYGKRWRILQDFKRLRVMSHPLLVIHDQKDRQVPWQEGKAFADAWPGAEFKATQGLGHNRILRDSDVIRRAVEFIDPPRVLSPIQFKKGVNYENVSSQFLEKFPQQISTDASVR